MDSTVLHQMLHMGLAEKFWHELNEESMYPVEFVDAALCFASLRDQSMSNGSRHGAVA